MVVFAVEGVCEIGKMTYELSDLWDGWVWREQRAQLGRWASRII